MVYAASVKNPHNQKYFTLQKILKTIIESVIQYDLYKYRQTMPLYLMRCIFCKLTYVASAN